MTDETEERTARGQEDEETAADSAPWRIGGATRGFLAGLLIGVLVGAGVALLLAPESGEVTRRRLARRTRRLAEDVREGVEAGRGKLARRLRRAEAVRRKRGEEERP